jgi:hypothetical protein
MARRLSKVRLAIAVLLGALGAFVTWQAYPPRDSLHWAVVGADIDRALHPFVNVAAADLRADTDRRADFVVPMDQQWRRIQQRMGPPDFIVSVGRPRTPDRMSIAYSVDDLHLNARVTRNGAAVPLELTGGLPWGYSSSTNQQSYKFAASPGDTISVRLALAGGAPPAHARVMVVAYWPGLEMWDWLDGAAMSQGISELLMPAMFGFGLLLVCIAAFIGRPFLYSAFSAISAFSVVR